jgi:hypothetical protein
MEERVIFSTLESAQKMDIDTRNLIENYNADTHTVTQVPLDIYINGYAHLGSANPSSLKRFANIAGAIYKYNLPIPPSSFIEWLARRIGGESKQDFSYMMDGDKGTGKSYSSAYFGGRFAMTMAEIYGGEPIDYFTIDNCCLLEDTKEIVNLLQKAKHKQYITIDDAGIAVGARDFAEQKNKNFNKIHATCRTKRWCLGLNVPVGTHLDLQIREVVTAKMNAYRSFHTAGFNLIKINSSSMRVHLNQKHPQEKRYSFHGKKFDYWVAYSPDILPDYKGFSKEYDKRRDASTDRVISQVVALEQAASEVQTERDKQWTALKKKHLPKIKEIMAEDGGKPVVTHIMQKTGVSQYRAYQLIAAIERGEE